MSDEVPCSKCGRSPTRPNWICDDCAIAELPGNFAALFFGDETSMPRPEYTPSGHVPETSFGNIPSRNGQERSIASAVRAPWFWLRRTAAKLLGLVEPTAIATAIDDAPQTSILAKTYGDVVARVIRVHDGDTITVAIDCWPAIIGTAIEVRLFGYDAPELKDPRPDMAGLAGSARDYVAGSLPAGTLVTLKNLRRDKYFRLLAGIHFADGSSLADRLYSLGLVRPYTGRGPKPW